MKEAVIMSKGPRHVGVCQCTDNCLCVPVCVHVWSRVPCVYVYVCFQARGSLCPPDLSSWVPGWAKGPWWKAVQLQPVVSLALGPLSEAGLEERGPCFSPRLHPDLGP